MEQKDGGPAFPMQEPQAIHAYAIAAVEGLTDTDERDCAYTKARAKAVGGMTLRDYFAAKAMAVVWADIPEDAHRELALDGLGRCAYEMADAMLKARQGTSNG